MTFHIFISSSFWCVLYFVFINVNTDSKFSLVDEWQQCIRIVQLLQNLPVVNQKKCESNKPLKDSYLKKLNRMPDSLFLKNLLNVFMMVMRRS